MTASSVKRDNRVLFRENLEDISPLSNANPFNLNIVQYNAGNRIDLTETPYVDDVIRRTLGPSAYLQMEAEEKEEEELTAKTFRFYLEGGELANMQRVINENRNVGNSVRQIVAENEERQFRQKAEIKRQQEIAEIRSRNETSHSPANGARQDKNSEKSSLTRAFNSARQGAAQIGEFISDRAEDVQEFASQTARQAANLAQDAAETAVDTGKSIVKTGFNAASGVASTVSQAADNARHAVSRRHPESGTEEVILLLK